MKRYTLLDLATFSDDRGSLTVLDNVLPFPIARSYWIYGADGQTRGGHRHLNRTPACRMRRGGCH